jgi:hypothetical protein
MTFKEISIVAALSLSVIYGIAYSVTKKDSDKIISQIYMAVSLLIFSSM